MITGAINNSPSLRENARRAFAFLCASQAEDTGAYEAFYNLRHRHKVTLESAPRLGKPKTAPYTVIASHSTSRYGVHDLRISISLSEIGITVSDATGRYFECTLKYEGKPTRAAAGWFSLVLPRLGAEALERFWWFDATDDQHLVNVCPRFEGIKAPVVDGSDLHLYSVSRADVMDERPKRSFMYACEFRDYKAGWKLPTATGATK